MSWVSGAVVFVCLWWVVLFTVLPIGIRGQHETDAVEWGTDPGAPTRSHMGRRLLITTGITLALWLTIQASVLSGLLTLETFNFLPSPEVPSGGTAGAD